MEIPQVIRDLPAQIEEGWNATVDFALNLAGSVHSFALGRFQSFSEHDFNQNWIQPWFERNVYPLQEKDYTLIFISLAASAALLAYVWDRFGDAAIPLGLCGACLIVGTTLFITQSSLKTYFDEKAWEHIDQIKKAAEDITNLNQDFTEITKEREVLQKPEFDNLKEDLKRLDTETQKFRADASAPDYEEKRNILDAHLDIVAQLVQANAHDKAILDALNREIDKAGTPEVDLAGIETQKQQLKNLQTPQVIAHHQAELIQQINELVKALQGPNFLKTKEAYLQFLNEMQQRLSSKLSTEESADAPEESSDSPPLDFDEILDPDNL